MNEIIKTTSKHISEFRALKDPFYHVSPREISAGFWNAEAALPALILRGSSCPDPHKAGQLARRRGALSGRISISVWFT